MSCSSFLARLRLDQKKKRTANFAVLQRARKWLIVSLLITAVGGHWAILQSVAWAQMLVRYSHGATLERGFTKTFSGKHPCKLCQLVKEGRKTERKQEMQKLELKLEFAFVADAALVQPPRPHQQPAATDATAEARLDEPPTPPPRFV